MAEAAIGTLDLTSVERDVAELANKVLTRESADQFLEGFGAYLGVTELTLDENGTVVLEVVGESEIGLAHVEGQPGFVAAIALDRAVFSSASVMLKLLKANLRFDLMQGSSFGALDTSGTPFLFNMVVPWTDDYARFDRELVAFITQHAEWAEAIDAALLRNETDPSVDLADVSVPGGSWRQRFV